LGFAGGWIYISQKSKVLKSKVWNNNIEKEPGKFAEALWFYTDALMGEGIDGIHFFCFEGRFRGFGRDGFAQLFQVDPGEAEQTGDEAVGKGKQSLAIDSYSVDLFPLLGFEAVVAGLDHGLQFEKDGRVNGRVLLRDQANGCLGAAFAVTSAHGSVDGLDDHVAVLFHGQTLGLDVVVNAGVDVFHVFVAGENALFLADQVIVHPEGVDAADADAAD
jgi:hypothetical protein